jgi:hypothetical protein
VERTAVRTPSPCIGVCKIVAGTGLCDGCLRTVDEITAWRDASEGERRRIVARTLERRRALSSLR